MFFDPNCKLETKAAPFSLAAVIAWLDRQPADCRYDYDDCKGGCLYGLYMNAIGIPWTEARTSSAYRQPNTDPHRQFRRQFYDTIARPGEWTFGAALARAAAAKS